MFFNMIKQLAKTRDFLYKNTLIFEKLLIVILIKNFYHFFIIIDCLLWNNKHTNKKHYCKMLKKSFNMFKILIK